MAPFRRSGFRTSRTVRVVRKPIYRPASCACVPAIVTGLFPSLTTSSSHDTGCSTQHTFGGTGVRLTYAPSFPGPDEFFEQNGRRVGDCQSSVPNPPVLRRSPGRGDAALLSEYTATTGASSLSIVMGSGGLSCLMSVHRLPFRTVVTGEQLPMTRTRPSRATVRRIERIRSRPSSGTDTPSRVNRRTGRLHGR